MEYYIAIMLDICMMYVHSVNTSRIIKQDSQNAAYGTKNAQMRARLTPSPLRFSFNDDSETAHSSDSV